MPVEVGREDAIEGTIRERIAQGRRIESQGDFGAVLTRGWFVESRELVKIDEWGNVSIEKLPLGWQRIIISAGLVLVILALILVSALTT